MLSDQCPPDDESCPVRDELLGELYSASKLGLPVLVGTVAPDIRALLALFCYRRSHLHAMGLVIAASCDEDDLVRSGGRVGAALFAKSREALGPMPVASHQANRRKITLARGSLRKMAPIDGESDEEASESVPAVHGS
jgi:hypothetical protein